MRASVPEVLAGMSADFGGSAPLGRQATALDATLRALAWRWPGWNVWADARVGVTGECRIVVERGEFTACTPLSWDRMLTARDAYAAIEAVIAAIENAKRGYSAWMRSNVFPRRGRTTENVRR